MFNFEYKIDTRAPLNGWCKGNYSCNCPSCNDNYMGDKRSSMCADCAYDKEKVLELKLKALLYTVDGMSCEYQAMNYGNAQNWLQYINKAYLEYQEAEASTKENL